MRVCAPGKVKLQLGEHRMEVSRGAACLFHQELLSVDVMGKECHQLGVVFSILHLMSFQALKFPLLFYSSWKFECFLFCFAHVKKCASPGDVPQRIVATLDVDHALRTQQQVSFNVRVFVRVCVRRSRSPCPLPEASGYPSG